MKYDVFYDKIKIGEFCINENSQEYIPFLEGIEKVESNGIKLLSMVKKEIRAKKIAFFDNLIRNCQNFKDIDSHVNGYSMKKINN